MVVVTIMVCSGMWRYRQWEVAVPPAALQGLGVRSQAAHGGASGTQDAPMRGLGHGLSFPWLWTQPRALSTCSVSHLVLVSCGQLLVRFLWEFM